MTDAELRALDELYAEEPSRFVARRDELARTLRAAGETEAASAIAKRKKPTQTAYLLNLLARRQPKSIERLTDVGRTLQRAQRSSYRSGDSGALREAVRAQQRTVTELVTASIALANELGVSASAHELGQAFQRAIVDPSVASELEAGTLSSVPELSGELDAFSAGVGPRREPERAIELERPKAAEKAAEKKERARRAAARKEAAALAKEARDAQRHADVLTAAAARVRAEADRALADAEALRRRAEEAAARTRA